jgi:hypothetical protein
MSITDELREWISSLYTPNSAELKLEGFAIADRIDEDAKDNEKFRDEAEPFCDRLREASSERADVTLFGVDYSALPLDVDGVPIHIGDRVEDNERVARIVLTDGSWEPSVYIEKAPCTLEEYFCTEVSHYHKPTVEDLLHEFFEEVGDGLHTLKAVDTQVIIAKYASKLRLADDGKEQ